MPDRVKKLVRARMQKTGESYQTALRHVRSQAPNVVAKTGEAITPVEREDEQYVRELFAELYGVKLRKVPESGTKSFDYELLSKNRRVAAIEVKRLGRVPRTPENGWVRTENGFLTRPGGDNSAARIGAAIHDAYKQLATATEPKVLVFVNDEHMDALDLKEALNGYLIYGSDDVGRYRNPSGMKIAEGRIRDEKRLIDLYVWINRYEGRTPHRVDGLPLETHAQRGPFFTFSTDAGYGLARRFFGVPETQRPENDPDAELPNLREMLLRSAGIGSTNMHVWASDVPMLIVAASENEAEQEHAREAAENGHRYPWMRRKPQVWRQLDDAEELTVQDPEPVTRPAGEWARLNGAGLLAVVQLTASPNLALPSNVSFSRPTFLGRRALSGDDLAGQAEDQTGA